MVEQNNHNAGYETLQAIAKAKSFNSWMFNTIRPYCQNKILEIGSGIGNISEFFIDAGYNITLSDVENFYVQRLKEKFPNNNVVCIDLENSDFFNTYKDLLESYDTVFLLNVIEHIRHDEQAIQNCFHLLKKNGNLIILTPAYPALYSKLDRELHHYRRYTTRSLKNKVVQKGFTIKKIFHFNFLGIAAWIYARIFRLRKVPSGEMSIYNRMVGLAKFLDKLVFKKWGLSLVVIAKK